MPQARQPLLRRESGALIPVPMRNEPRVMPRGRLLLQMHAQWKLRAHQGYLEAASFCWPRPVHAGPR